MSTNPVSMRFPFALKDQSEEVRQAHIFAFNGLLDLNKAIASLKSQIGTSTTSATTTTTSSGGTVIVNGSNFPGLGAIRDETGVTAYTNVQADNGILLILNDASPVAVTLDSSMVVPYFLVVTNFGMGLATLTPTSGNINSGASYDLSQNESVWLVFDGTNWKTNAIAMPPKDTPSVAHQFITAYAAATGVFTQAQPAFSDISGTVASAQLPTPTASTLGGVESAGPTASQWINEIDTSGVPHLSQPAFSDISGNLATSQLPTAGLSVTITTAALTAGGTQGSMTFTNGILTAQVQAT